MSLYVDNFHLASLFFFFWLHHKTCGILVPPPGIKPAPPALEGQSFNHWTARESPIFTF